MQREYTILVDSREKRPLRFPSHLHMLDDTAVPTSPRSVVISLRTRSSTLETGDYQLDGYPHLVVVERKGSLSELAMNCTKPQPRRRFVAECERLRSSCRHPVILLEGTPQDLVRRWRTEDGPSPWPLIDAFQRLCLEYGIEIRYCAMTGAKAKLAVGEEIAHLLINGALLCPPQQSPPTCTVPPTSRGQDKQST